MFDIDKLGLSTINWDIKNNKASDQFEEGSEKYYQNQLIRDYITLLIDPLSQHILHRSIDNDTKLLKDVLKEIESSNNTEEQPYGFYSLSTLTERKNDYITGKIGIGPFALNNNNHILTMLYGVRFKEFDDSIMTTLGLNDLSKNTDYEGNSILSWISALINAHVDIAKDPYIGRLNVNQFTYNLVNTLIRTGFGKKTFYFTTQPIMKELANAYNKAGSSYMADQYKSQYQLQLEALDKVAKDRFEQLKLEGWTFDEIVEGIQNPQDIKYKPVINNYIRQIFNSSVLKDNANKDFDKTYGTTVHTFDDLFSENASESNEIHLTNEQVQMLMYFAYLQFNPYALSVSNLVKYSKIDTKKHGKSYIEQQVYQKGFRDLFYNRNGSGLFEEEGISKMAESSYIALKTNNAISTTKNILKGQFLLATNAFDDAVDYILASIGKADSKNIDLHKTISQVIMASIKSEFINQYSDELRPDDKKYIRDLVSESEENLSYTQMAQSNRLKVVGNPRHDLSTYIGSKVYVQFEHEGTPWNFAYTVLGYDAESNELIVDATRKVNNTGKMRIVCGKNTIYDRFLRLAVELRDDPEYQDVLDSAGEPTNALLRNLVTGNTFEYKSPIQSGIIYSRPEREDTYPTLKFIKLFNALDQNGVESNLIIDGWDELLHDNKHPKLKKFAEDLVVYAFVTSGDQGGFTKFFKLVPLSWRLESGYADFIQRKLVEYQFNKIPVDQLQDAILNNWFDNQLIPKYDMYNEDDKIPNFITYSGEMQKSGYRAEIPYPVILAALKDDNGSLSPSIDPDMAPLFIKIPRRNDKQAKDSQRRVTVYKRVSYGMRQSSTGVWVHYPIYIKVEPKGNQLKGNYLMTEYGREDSIDKEYTPSEEGLKKMYKLGDFISKNTVQQYSVKWGSKYAQMIEDMNYRDLFVNVYGGNENKFNKALNTSNTETTPNFYVGQVIPEENVIFVFGSNPEGRHGAGAAKLAKEQFGAIYGQGEGLQGNSYALPTKDLRIKENNGHKSISPEQITENIRKMYEVARQNPDKIFKVADYPLDKVSLNGYSGREMLQMFKDAGPVPENVWFNSDWEDAWLSDPYVLAMKVDDDKVYDSIEYFEKVKRDTKDSLRLYNLTRKVKNAINSRFVLLLNPDGVTRDEILIGKQTESFDDGKYVSVRLKNYSEEKFKKLVDLIKTLSDNNSDWSYIIDGYRILVKNKYYEEFDIPVKMESSQSHEDVISYLYNIIRNEPSEESAESVLNGYSDMYSQEELNAALGRYISKKCKGE